MQAEWCRGRVYPHLLHHPPHHHPSSLLPRPIRHPAAALHPPFPRTGPIPKIPLNQITHPPVPRPLCVAGLPVGDYGGVRGRAQVRVWAKVGIRQLPGVVGLPRIALLATEVRKRQQRPPLPPRLLLGTDGPTADLTAGLRSTATPSPCPFPCCRRPSSPR